MVREAYIERMRINKKLKQIHNKQYAFENAYGNTKKLDPKHAKQGKALSNSNQYYTGESTLMSDLISKSHKMTKGGKWTKPQADLPNHQAPRYLQSYHGAWDKTHNRKLAVQMALNSPAKAKAKAKGASKQKPAKSTTKYASAPAAIDQQTTQPQNPQQNSSVDQTPGLNNTNPTGDTGKNVMHDFRHMIHRTAFDIHNSPIGGGQTPQGMQGGFTPQMTSEGAFTNHPELGRILARLTGLTNQNGQPTKLAMASHTQNQSRPGAVPGIMHDGTINQIYGGGFQNSSASQQPKQMGGNSVYSSQYAQSQASAASPQNSPQNQLGK